MPKTTGKGAQTSRKQLEIFLESRRNGATVESSAAAAGTSHTTIYNIRDVDPAFAKEMQEAAEFAIKAVESALFKSALTPEGKTDRIFFLCNRAYQRWRSVNNIQISGPDGKPLQVEQRVKVLPDEALLAMDSILAAGGMPDREELIQAAVGGNGKNGNGNNGGTS
jgi:hypothetical protein